MTEIITCPVHGYDVFQLSQAEADNLGVDMGCPVHNEDMDRRPDVRAMTPQQRADELTELAESELWCSLDRMVNRLSALVGRPLMTHELAYTHYLVHEILTGTVPTVEGIIAKLPHDKATIVIQGDD